MDYREYKIMMAVKDPAYKFMSDAELLKKYEEYKSNTEKNKLDSSDSKIQYPYAKLSKNVNSNEVVITNIDIPFGSMVKFIIKWSLASIPAIVILTIIYIVILTIIAGL